MFTVKFWKLSTERAMKSAAQAVILGLGVSNTGPFNLFDMDPATAFGFAGGGALLSYLTSLISAPLTGDHDSPSLVEEN